MFLALFLSFETNLNNNIENIAKIQDNVYKYWYYVFDILRSSFIVKVAKLLVNKETSVAVAQKDKKISLKIVDKTQKEIFWLIMTRLLYIYIRFAIDSLNFSQLSL